MSGTVKGRNDVAKKHLDVLEGVLDRATPIDSLKALTSAIDYESKDIDQLDKVAIGLDSSVFLKLCSHPKTVDILDYLESKFNGPLIIPGQAIQEFWNNQFSAVDTVAAALKKKFDALKAEASKVDNNFGDFSGKIDTLLNEFHDNYGYVYDISTRRNTSQLLEILNKKAFLSYVPRIRFHNIALQRRKTKTPPGFKDDGDGDFFIWVEFLYGLLHLKSEGKSYDHAVIVTNDQKVDWSRAGVAHPILTAEVDKLIGATFETWNVDELYKRINQQISSE